jgi:hypothetical protein
MTDHSSNVPGHVITVSPHMALYTIVEIEDESKEDKPIDVYMDIKSALDVDISSPSRTPRMEDTPNTYSTVTRHEYKLDVTH